MTKALAYRQTDEGCAVVCEDGLHVYDGSVNEFENEFDIEREVAFYPFINENDIERYGA